MCGRQLKSSSIIMPRFSDDTPIEGLITNAESAFRKVGRVVDWCTKNNLELNVAKKKRENKRDHGHRLQEEQDSYKYNVINNQRTTCGTCVDSFKLLGTTIAYTLKTKGTSMQKPRQSSESPTVHILSPPAEEV